MVLMSTTLMSLNILIVVVSITKECFTFYIAAERFNVFSAFFAVRCFCLLRCVQQNV